MEKLEQIIKLVDAGYTKEEITNLLNGSVAAVQDTAELPAELQAEPAVEEPKKAEPAADSKIDDAIAKLEKLSENMAKLAIMNSQQPPKEDIQDYLARIIDPTYKKKEE